MEKIFSPKCVKCGNNAEYYNIDNKKEMEYRCKDHRIFIKGYRVYSRKSGFYYTYLGKGSSDGLHWFQDVTKQEFSMTQKEIEKNGMVVVEN